MELICTHAEEDVKVNGIETECMVLTCEHAEGVVPFSGNSFSFTSLIATITLVSAFVGSLVLNIIADIAPFTFCLSSSFGRNRAPRLRAFPPFCIAVQDSAEKKKPGEKSF